MRTDEIPAVGERDLINTVQTCDMVWRKAYVYARGCEEPNQPAGLTECCL